MEKSDLPSVIFEHIRPLCSSSCFLSSTGDLATTLAFSTMVTSKRFIIFLMLAIQLLCSGFLAHAFSTSKDPFSGPDGT